MRNLSIKNFLISKNKFLNKCNSNLQTIWCRNLTLFLIIEWSILRGTVPPDMRSAINSMYRTRFVSGIHFQVQNIR